VVLALAAAIAVRRREATRVVVAVPAAPLHGCNAIQIEADDFVTVVQPEHLFAVSQYYMNFEQVSDATVESLLQADTRTVLAQREMDTWLKNNTEPSPARSSTPARRLQSNRGAFVFLPGFLLEAQHSSAQATSISPLTAVDNVDLLRYAGMK
jgi:hypothetical protein